MGIYICRKCGRQFEAKFLSNGYCDDCNTEYYDKYHQVREYLWNHPNTTADVVAKACDCSVHQVMIWVKEERFLVSEDSKVFLYCENCGKKILSGKYCPECQAVAARNEQEAARASRIRQHSEQMHGTSVKKPDQDDGHMRFLH
ncbi:MAG: hypothetical protein J6O70_07175 [Lachnospiraceae bacterium]|nr:hypothetical protein [Lachnospiraceae bacterium]